MTNSNEIIDYCANESCSAPIHFGQACMQVGHELVCSGACLVAKLGAVITIAGKEENECTNKYNASSDGP